MNIMKSNSVSDHAYHRFSGEVLAPGKIAGNDRPRFGRGSCHGSPGGTPTGRRGRETKTQVITWILDVKMQE